MKTKTKTKTLVANLQDLAIERNRTALANRYADLMDAWYRAASRRHPAYSREQGRDAMEARESISARYGRLCRAVSIGQ